MGERLAAAAADSHQSSRGALPCSLRVRRLNPPVRLPTSPSSLENLLWLPPQGGRCPGQGSRESGEGGATRRPEGGGPAGRTCRQENPPTAPSRLAHVLGLQPGRRVKAPHPTGRGVLSRTHLPGRKNGLPAPPSSGTETGIGILRRGRATAPRPPAWPDPSCRPHPCRYPTQPVASPDPARKQYSVRRYLPSPSLEHLFYFRLD